MVLQADLYRTEQDVERINALGARIRLVKGAYREPAAVAYQKKADVDAAYARLMKRLLVAGTYPAIATHDEAMIDARAALRDRARTSRRIGSSSRCCTASGATCRRRSSREGYRVRVYIPFGRQWFPYFMRRLGERPANVGFVVRGICATRLDEARRRDHRRVGRHRPRDGASARPRRRVRGASARGARDRLERGRRRDRRGRRHARCRSSPTSRAKTDMQAFVGQTVARFGRLDVMICNAGFGVYGAIDQIAPEQMQRMMDVNYLGTFNAARAALPVFRRQQRGHFVIMSSIVGKRGVPYMGAYAATKFAQVGLAECLRAELVGTRHSRQRRVSDLDRNRVLRGDDSRVRLSRRARAGRGRRPTTWPTPIARAIEQPVPEVYPYTNVARLWRCSTRSRPASAIGS